MCWIPIHGPIGDLPKKRKIKKRKVNQVILSQKPLYLIFPKDLCLSSNSSSPSTNFGLDEILKDFNELFKDTPLKIPSLIGIDLILGSTYLNK